MTGSDDDVDGESGVWPSQDLPAGWEWHAFESFFENVTSSRLKLNEKRYAETGRCAVVDQGSGQIGGYTDDETLLHPGPLPALIFGDHTRRVKYIDHPFVQGADGVKVLIPKRGIDGRYAFWALNTVRLPDKGYSRHFKFLAATKFPLAPFAEQRRIVAKIEALTQKSRRAKEALDAIPPLLERFRQSVLASAFRGDLTKDWRAKHPDVEPAEELLKRIRQERRKRWEEAELAKLKANGKTPKDDRWKEKYEEPAPVDAEGLPDLPAGWCWASLASLTDPVRLIRYGMLMPGPEVPGGVPYVKVKHMRGDSIVPLADLPRTTHAMSDQFAGAVLAKGDLLLSIRGTYGRIAVVADELDGANITQDSARVAPMSGVDREYLAGMLRSPYAQRYFDDIAKGVAVRGINIGDIRPMPVPLAPVAEQRVIARATERGCQVIGKVGVELAQVAARYASLDASILAKAFRGELTNGVARE